MNTSNLDFSDTAPENVLTLIWLLGWELGMSSASSCLLITDILLFLTALMWTTLFHSLRRNKIGDKGATTLTELCTNKFYHKPLMSMFVLTIVCLLGIVLWDVQEIGGQTLLHFSKCVSSIRNLYWLTSLMYG